MKTNKEQLMKHFATVLRNKANGKNDPELLKAPALRNLSRKDLIEIITSPHFMKSKSIKEIDLLKMENEELLEAIGHQMIIIAFVTEKWSCEVLIVETKTASQLNNKPNKSKK